MPIEGKIYNLTEAKADDLIPTPPTDESVELVRLKDGTEGEGYYGKRSDGSYEKIVESNPPPTNTDIIRITGELNYTDFQPSATPSKTISLADVPIGYTPLYGIIENEIEWTINSPSPMYQADIKIYFGLNNNALLIEYFELRQVPDNLSNRYSSNQSTVLPNVYDKNTVNPLSVTLTVQAALIDNLISGKLKYHLIFIKTNS